MPQLYKDIKSWPETVEKEYILRKLEESAKDDAEKNNGVRSERTQRLQDELVEAQKKVDARLREADKKDLDNNAEDPEKIIRDSVNIQVSGDPIKHPEVDTSDKLPPEIAKKAVDDLMYTRSGDREVKELQRLNDQLLVLGYARAVASGKPVGDEYRLKPEDIKDTRTFKEFSTRLSSFRKAMDTATAAEGYEWVPTSWSADWIDLVELETVVMGLHPHVTIPQGAGTLTIPRKSSHVTAYYVPEATDDAAAAIPASTMGTGNVPLTPKKIAARTWISAELTEDSILNVFDIVRSEFAQQIARAIENAVINGSDTAAKNDLDNTATALWTASSDPRFMWDGYRQWAASSGVTTVSLATYSYANVVAIRTNCGKFGMYPRNGVWLVGVDGMDNLLTLSQVATREVYGDRATVVTGEIMQLAGSPVVLSGYIYGPVQGTGLNTAGVYDGSTVTKTVMLYVYRDGFIFGDKRQLSIKMENDIDTDQYKVVGTTRVAFSGRYVSTDDVVGVGYNFA